MKTFILCLMIYCTPSMLYLAFVGPAAAEQPSSSELALSGKLTDEINSDLQVRNALAQAQAKIADLQKQIDAAPKCDAPAPDKK
jgi:hypothetical protein